MAKVIQECDKRLSELKQKSLHTQMLRADPELSALRKEFLEIKSQITYDNMDDHMTKVFSFLISHYPN